MCWERRTIDLQGGGIGSVRAAEKVVALQDPPLGPGKSAFTTDLLAKSERSLPLGPVSLAENVVALQEASCTLPIPSLPPVSRLCAAPRLYQWLSTCIECHGINDCDPG